MIGENIDVNVAGGLSFPLPKMSVIRQKFNADKIENIKKRVAEEFLNPDIQTSIKPGQVIAVGCGSRGIANISEIVLSVINELKARGARPFIFPCMGSHGSATAEGQKNVLESYGITQDAMGVEIRSSMDTLVIGSLDDGTPVYMDQYAAKADGVVVVNRIKPHTSFRGEIESGITKMLSIGIGKIVGATTYHRQGMDTFPELLPRVRDCHLKAKNILFGVGILENAYDQTSHIEIIEASKIAIREPELQVMAKQKMPRLMFSDIDVLIIDEMGKNISGAGFDPNITGRSRSVENWDTGLKINKIVVLSLSKESHGNATGIGGADVTTMRLYKDLDVSATYANCITSMSLGGAAIPVVMNNDREAIALAIKTVVRVQPENCKIVRIKNTLSLETIEVSQPLVETIRENSEKLEIISGPKSFAFSSTGDLIKNQRTKEEQQV